MTQPHHDPSVQWAGQLSRLDGWRRDAVVAALRYSAGTGWPAPEGAVEPLVAYALGEITSHEYSRQVLLALDLGRASGTSPQAVETGRVDAEPAVEAAATTDQAEADDHEDDDDHEDQAAREESVRAYVTGQITVGEFLRAARG